MKQLTLTLSIVAASMQLFSQQQSPPKPVKKVNLNYSYNTSAVEFNGRYYSNGANELFTSDGTENGSFAVRSFASQVNNITPMNGKLYFIASDGASGNELWVSDGTATGTALVKDINPTGNGVYRFSWDNALVVMNNNLYFYGFDGSNGVELWKSDGTAQGTQMVMDVNAGPGSVFDTTAITPINESLLAVNNKVFFTANDGVHGGELWVTDGTAPGTSMVTDLYTGMGPSYPPDNFKRFDNRVVFFAIDNTGVGVFISDGTAGGTMKLLPDWGGWENGYIVDNNKLYFFADSSWSMGSITRLCVSDGTPGGTQAFKDVYPLNINTSRLGFLTAYNNKLYFSAAATQNGEIELWTSDGTAVGTQLFKNLVATTASSQPAQLTIFNGKLYMRSVDTSGRNEIWESDGTDQGTKKVPYANADAKLSGIVANTRNRGMLTRVGNSLFFLNYYGAKDGNAFYKIDQFPDLVNEVPAANTLDVYPNPAQGKLHFSRPVKNIFIYTTEGKVVYHAEKETQAIDIGGLPAATYFVSAEADDGMQLNKLIIKQ